MSENEDRVDLSAWNAQLPPSDFAERVLSAVRESSAPAEAPAAQRRSSSRSRRWGFVASATVGLSLAAAIALRVTTLAEAEGAAIAEERVEVSVGARARAVLEPKAAIRWKGDVVEQAQGDVFYRVEPGARFRVRTPAGDVEVLGTCFTVRVRGGARNEEPNMMKRDVKAAVAGAGLAALAFVAVQEGRVAVSSAAERLELTAGESASLGPSGLKKSRDVESAEKAFEDEAKPLTAANENLVTQVSEYRKRLEAIAVQKSELEHKLETTERKLEAAREAGVVAKAKHEYDLGPEEWRELAKEGTIMARTPCFRKKDWRPSAEALQKLGLAPQDGDTLRDAYMHSNDRLWAAIKPLCAAELGSVEAAEKLGPFVCENFVLDRQSDKDPEASEEAMRQSAEIRAGTRPPPGPNDPVHPLVKLFLATTGEAQQFEAELARSLGPEEAHRITFAEDLCVQQSRWRGPGPRAAKP